MEGFRIPVEIIDLFGNINALQFIKHLIEKQLFESINKKVIMLSSAFSGSKTTVYEGGVRVPGFIHGPKKYFPKSFDYKELFHISDFYPTILQIIGHQDILSKKPHETLDGVAHHTTTCTTTARRHFDMTEFLFPG